MNFNNKIKEIELALNYSKKYIISNSNFNIKPIISISFIYLTTIVFNSSLYWFNSILLESLYWFILGILSTIGLGFGFHTGIFFLFPYLTNTYDNQLIINPEYALYYTFLKCLFNIILWGVGSAIGELPPYILAYKEQELELENKDIKKSIQKYINWIKKYIDITNKKTRFIIILFMASWPNITFDMCGVICGYNKLSVTEFLLPTIIGKGLIKGPIQSLVVLYLYKNGENYNLLNISPGYFTILFNGCFILLIGYFLNKLIIRLSIMETKKE